MITDVSSRSINASYNRHIWNVTRMINCEKNGLVVTLSMEQYSNDQRPEIWHLPIWLYMNGNSIAGFIRFNRDYYIADYAINFIPIHNHCGLTDGRTNKIMSTCRHKCSRSEKFNVVSIWTDCLLDCSQSNRWSIDVSAVRQTISRTHQGTDGIGSQFKVVSFHFV